jgi:transposase
MRAYDQGQDIAKANKAVGGFDIIHTGAAGIDVGASEMWVCVPPGRVTENVRRFGTVTSQLQLIAQWLKECAVKTVAMESTGVYWIPLFQILEAAGFDVYLVNAQHVKNVPGRRKTDRLDCQWLQKLHACGLLNGSFRPAGDLCRLRSYLRHRDTLIVMGVQHIQHMQKALREMNVLLDQVVSDITGTTGLRIITAILDGNRNFAEMASWRDRRLKASETQIVEALRGDYRAEHIFVLRQALEAYRFVEQQIQTCNREVEQLLIGIEKAGGKPKRPLPEGGLTGREKRRGNAPDYDVQSHLYQMTGVDLTRAPGLGAAVVQSLIAETGTDMSPWPTEKHFASWLGLAPDPKISGGHIIGHNHRHVQSRAAKLFRTSAMTLHRSPTWLGAFYRRMKGRLGGRTAVNATAHKLAVLYYRMLESGRAYQDMSAAEYEQRFQKKMLQNLKRRAKQYGFELVESPNPVPVL